MDYSEYEPKGFKVKPMSTLAIRSIAVSVMPIILELAKVKEVKQINFEDFLERVLPLLGIELDVIPDNSTADIGEKAPAAMVGSVLKVKDACYAGMNHGNPRDIFTLFHELGHYFLGHTRRYTRDELTKHKAYEDSECQANAFAGECLMPLEIIKTKNLKNVVEIHREFGIVSFDAAWVRYKKLQRLGELS
ncbi:MAG TPA: ImmA/IrrE family metallo-endopeptidase [Candidatus Parasutterella gallistercoris]|jgi:Zn-dependent peptidase ImmA (M78 family)|nr:MAG TPA: IrrE protein [Caudoviricetes sp.]HIV44698.1 ImmA/IrrE family metallo-endopeptidase [Candidatus Parasutterella gallistercoris]